MGLLTFDWSQVIYVGSPLMVPWFAQANAMFAFVLFYWILCPILYYTNVRICSSDLTAVPDFLDMLETDLIQRLHADLHW
jgi:hypothetical protein